MARFAPLVAVLAVALLSHAAVAQKLRCIAFSTGHDLWGYRQPHTDESLRRLKLTHANCVHITAYMKIPSLTARTWWQETDDASVRYIIRKAKSFGFRVFFKPTVEVRNHLWRGWIKGDAWFFHRMFTPFMLKMARIAQEEGVELFSVGSEMRDSEHQYKKWVHHIKRIRRVFKGTITYVANHDSYKTVPFWHHVDVISVSAYFSMLPGKYGKSPNLKRTKEMWLGRAKTINNWRKRKGFRYKKILVAEMGVQSKGRGVVYRVPWDWKVKAPTNFWEQVKMYEGALNAFMPPYWSYGVCLWNWELDPNAGTTWPSIQWYTPQGKPAEAVMTKYFKRWY